MRHIPRDLLRQPFTLEEARNAGLTLDALAGTSWRRLGTELYCWRGWREDPWQLISGWRRVLPKEALFAGRTAAWLHGIDLDPIHPIEVIVPATSGVRSRPGLNVRRCHRVEAVAVRGLHATSLLRTLSDLSLRLPPVEVLVAMDAAVRLGLVEARSLTRPRRLRWLADIAAPAESPMETRLRWLLLEAGLPRPEVQTGLHDAKGRFVGRADLYYPRARLVIEYDGSNHRERLVEDNRRQNLLIKAGFALLRFTAADIHGRPAVVTAQVAELLRVTNHRGQPPHRRRHEDLPGAA